VPQVASDPTIHAHSPHLPRAARSAQPSDRAPSPFESLIDDGSQPAEQPAPAPTDNKIAATNGSQPPAKTDDTKAPVANDAAPAAKPDDEASVAKPDDGQTVCDTKVVADTKLADGVTTDDDPETESGDKPTDGQKTDKPVIATSPTNVQATNSADAIVVAPTTTPIATVPSDQGDQDGGPKQIVLVTETGLPLKSLDVSMPKAASGKKIDGGQPAEAGQQAEADQSVDDIADGSQSTPKSSQQAHTDKPQFNVSESDKAHVADARGEPAVDGHRGNSDTQVSVTADSGAATPKIIGDPGTQPTVQTTTNAASNEAAPATLVSQPGPQAAAIPLSGVAMEIAGKAFEGKNRFEIRLDPPELGRIEVRLDVDKDGNVTSRMTVDRADTLDLLRRDATGLERALQDAGLKTADNSLQFSLRDQSMGQQQTGAGPEAAQMIVTDDTLPSVDAIPQNYGRIAGTGGGLDIRV
jgi:flagellar hook-length control protein FliK